MTNAEDAGRITRAEAARRLHVSPAALNYWELKGRLTATRADGHVWYSAAEVEALRHTWTPKRRPRTETEYTARRRPSTARGRLAAKVFAMLADGADHRAIVIATKADPRLVHELWLEYRHGFEERERIAREEEEQRIAERYARDSDKQRKRDEWMRFQERMAKSREKTGYVALPSKAITPSTDK